MQMGNGNDDDLACRRLVNDAIGKAPQLAAPNTATQRRPRIRKFPNALHCKPGFIPKFATQPRPLAVVILDRFDQLALRWIEQSNLHTR